MDPTYIVLLILTIIYVPFYIWVRRSPKAAARGLVKYGPCVMIKTKWGTGMMERLSVYKRFWKFFGALSLAISMFLMVFLILIIVVGISNISASLAAPGIGWEKGLAIPGLNPLIPIHYGWLGLVVAMVVHELAHGMQTRANNMRVDSTGVLYGVIPLGAFVEPNEEDIEKSSRRAKLDLYSAGISVNFIVAVAIFSIFAVLMLGNVSSSYGDNTGVYAVSSDSPAHSAGIPSGAIIELVNGEEYFYWEDHTMTYSWEPGDVVQITYLTKDSEHTADLIWGLFIESVTKDSPAWKLNESDKEQCESDKTACEPEKVLYKTFILSINGEKIHDYLEFLSFMQTTKPGETADILCMTADGTETFTKTLTLGDNGGVGYIGIGTSVSGMSFTTPDIILDTGRNPIYGAESITTAAWSMLTYIGGPLKGFSPIPEVTHWWYDVPLGDMFWVLVSVLYWIFWLNIMLGVSNAIPAYPFDGGFIFQGGLSALLQRLGMKDEKRREKITASITSSLSLVMIFMLVLVMAAVLF
ncbi:MAG: site-2 protease family protein [Methanomassiliicoccaceae archaeon]|nr:site-2 protease family protein [Methanomassiliicoccaceae archaeon]